MVNQGAYALSLLLRRLVDKLNKWIVFVRCILRLSTLVLLLYFYARLKLKTFIFFFLADFLENFGKFFIVDLGELLCFLMDRFGPGFDII